MRNVVEVVRDGSIIGFCWVVALRLSDFLEALEAIAAR